ncbi:MAG: SAM-dependent methyltransferase [Burkholderiales bacterium]|nr:MAG: SAM-dependent methyltransferase [Burkholderiales bacterium]
MALMFQRLAHNFIKNGYYPTDAQTISGVLSLISTATRSVRIHDPCCGEGTALAEMKNHLASSGGTVTALGIEYDAERAWHAKQLLDVAIHSDVHDVVLSHRSCGLLFLNPPYGDSVSDAGMTGDGGKNERLELLFLKRTFNCLQYGGVLVYIVPHYIVNENLASVIARNFTQVRYYMAPESKFKQCVILGVRKRSGHLSTAMVKSLVDAASGHADAPVLLESAEPIYTVPELVVDPDFRFQAVRIDGPQLVAEMTKYRANTLWPQFRGVFGQVAKDHRAPLRELSKWHLALALAAGQITGTVRSASGRTLFIKGDTFKEKARAVENSIDEDGNVSQTVVLTDKFVPVIRGIEFTPGENYGEIVTIR